MRGLPTLLLLAGCALNPFESTYIPPGAPLSAEGPPLVGIGHVPDSRIAAALRTALAARSLLAPGAPAFLISAEAIGPAGSPRDLHLLLTDAAGHPRTTADTRITRSSVFASPSSPAREMNAASLSEAIDDALDQPAFRAALQPDRPPRDTIL